MNNSYFNQSRKHLELAGNGTGAWTGGGGGADKGSMRVGLAMGVRGEYERQNEKLRDNKKRAASTL